MKFPYKLQFSISISSSFSMFDCNVPQMSNPFHSCTLIPLFVQIISLYSLSYLLYKKRRIKRYLHYILRARTKETKPIQRNWWMNFFPFYLLLIRYFWKLYFLLLTFCFSFPKQKHFRIELLLFFHFLLLTSRCLSIKSYIRHSLYFNLVYCLLSHIR